MRLLVFVISLVTLNISLVCCFSGNAQHFRVKRSNETEGFSFKKVKDGFKVFGSKVSDVTSKGYEEFKNLFAKDRKVGDYTINKLDVRVAEEEDYEEVAVKRPKRETSNDATSFMYDELEEIMKDINVLQTTKRNTSSDLIVFVQS